MPTINPDTVVLIRHFVAGLLVLIVAGLIGVGVWYGSRVDSLTITKVVVRGGETINHRKIKDITFQTLHGMYVGLVPRKFAWFYPKEEILETLHKIERIHNISTVRESGTTLSIYFEEYTPSALWCDSVESEACMFIDSYGYSFGQAPRLLGGALIRFISTGKKSTVGEMFTYDDSLESLFKTGDLLSERGWYISHIELDQVGDAFLTVVGGGELKVTASVPPEETIANLFVVLESEQFSHIKPGNFQYIDLRFGNKIFVNEEEKSITIPEDVLLDDVFDSISGDN